MGRRHLSRVIAAVAIALTFATPAGAAIRWRLLADGPSSSNSSPATTAYVALDRAATARFSARLTDAASAKLGRVDFQKDALIAIFGEFGCRDHRIVVSTIVQHGGTLATKLVEHSLKPGTMECMAIYQTYRFVLIAKSMLDRPYPTRASVTLARA